MHIDILAEFIVKKFVTKLSMIQGWKLTVNSFLSVISVFFSVKTWKIDSIKSTMG